MALPSRQEQIQGVQAELARSRGLPPYEAIDAAWLALLKATNMLPGKNEHVRTAALLQRLTPDSIRPVLHSAAVNTLLNLTPPLESLLTAAHEEIDGPHTARQLDVVRSQRQNTPHEALTKLVSVLRRVRNRRMHGFKTPDGPRDEEILTAATDILQQLGAVVLATLP
jgi:hypothetical protein